MRKLLPISLCLSLLLISGSWSSAFAKELKPHRLTSVSKISNDPTLKSSRGREIMFFRFPASDGTAEYKFYIQGGLHGNETLPPVFVTWLARKYARGKSLLNLLPQDNIEIDFLPIANPDGMRMHRRFNAKGVDLNRNFSILWGTSRTNPGEKPFSEPETRSIRWLFNQQKYTAAIDVHGTINWIVAPSSPGDVPKLAKKHPKKINKYGAWIDSLIDESKKLYKYQLHTGSQLGDGGAFEDWAFWQADSLAFCLELSSEDRYTFETNEIDTNVFPGRDSKRVDSFVKYESMIFSMFKKAMKINKAKTIDVIADTNKPSTEPISSGARR